MTVRSQQSKQIKRRGRDVLADDVHRKPDADLRDKLDRLCVVRRVQDQSPNRILLI